MSMESCQYFHMNASDWLSHPDVQLMSIEGEGCYIRLLCYAWKQGFIPGSSPAQARLCKGYDGPGLAEAVAQFKPLNGDLTKLINSRQEEDRQRLINHRKALSDNGKKGAEAKKQAKPKPRLSKAKAPLKHSIISKDIREEWDTPPQPLNGAGVYPPSTVADDIAQRIIDEDRKRAAEYNAKNPTVSLTKGR